MKETSFPIIKHRPLTIPFKHIYLESIQEDLIQMLLESKKSIPHLLLHHFYGGVQGAKNKKKCQLLEGCHILPTIVGLLNSEVCNEKALIYR